MKTRRLLATSTALAAATAGLVTAAPARAADAPTGVTTTMTLLSSSAHRIISTGHAPPASTVVLQRRLDKHRAYRTVRSGRASASGRFELKVALEGDTYDKYRVCTVAPSGKACSRGAKPTILRRGGTVTVTQRPPQLTVETIGQYAVHLSKWLRHQVVRLEFQDPQGKWHRVWDVDADGQASVSFETVLPGDIGGLDIAFRFVALGSRDIARVRSAVFRMSVYRTFPLAQLTPLSGSLVVTIGPYGGDYVGPAGTGPTVTATLALPANCGRVSFAVFVRPELVQPEDAFSASVAVDGVTIYSHSPADGQQYAELPITLPPNPKQLTLTTSYDASRPDHRPWFAIHDLNPFVGGRSPRVFCATSE